MVVVTVSEGWQSLANLPQLLRKLVNLYLPIPAADSRFTG